MHPESAPLWSHIGQAREDGGWIDGVFEAHSQALEINPGTVSPLRPFVGWKIVAIEGAVGCRMGERGDNLRRRRTYGTVG